MTIDASAVAAAGLTWSLVALALYVWTAIALAAVFRKSGEPAWAGWVPVYNQVVLFRLGGVSPFLLLLYLVPGAGAVAVWILQIIACHRINAAFTLGTGMTVLAALVFPVWASILGFGSARWVGEEEAGPRRIGVPAPEATPVFPQTGPIPPMPGADETFHGRSTLVAPEDPLFATSSEAVAPPAPAPGRPTPFAPSARTAPDEDEPVGPVAGRAESPVSPPPGGWAPSVPGDASRTHRRDEFDGLRPPPVPEDSVEVTGAIPGAPEPMPAAPWSLPDPAPVTRAPAAARPSPGPEPEQADAGPADDEPMAPEPWAPTRSPHFDTDAFSDSSGAVSAIAGAPDAGSPRSALSSVSAQNRRPQIPDDAFDETIIARRRRTDWSLVTPSGDPVPIGAEVVLLGRRPQPDPGHPSAQLISIDDGTVSKTHARLELRGDTWWVTDLNSTNGVVFATLLGTEVEATPGVAIEAGDRFLLGDAEIRLARSVE
ncbi:DUF5684 domain-containing protein [Microbacterium sp. NPDC055357]